MRPHKCSTRVGYVKLSDSILLTGYQLRFILDGQSTATIVGSKSVSQLTRGIRFDFTRNDDDYLRHGNGTFALDIQGVSRSGQSVNITAFTPYPPPNGR